MSLPFNHSLAIALRPVLREASKAIMNHYQAAKIWYETKPDGSLITKADTDSNEILINRISGLFPDIPIVSEENFQPKKYPLSKEKAQNGYFLIDPLDGTQGFLQKNGQFAINIALIYQNTPVFGYIWSPTSDKGYFGAKDFGAYIADGAFYTNLITPKKNHFGPCNLIISSHENNIERIKLLVKTKEKREISKITQYSSSLKFGMLCEGIADIYPRMQGCSEWDIAAGHAIILGALGKMTNLIDDSPIIYGRPDARVSPFICVI